MEFGKLVSKQIKSRGGYKLRIKLTLNKLNDTPDLTQDLFTRQQDSVYKWLDKIDEINTSICDICDEKGITDDDVSREADNQNEADYLTEIFSELSKISSLIKTDIPPHSKPLKSDIDETDSNNLLNALNKLNSNPIRPKLECSKFSGKGTDKFEFKNFLVQFENCVNAGNNLSRSAKLTYLRSYLVGYAFKIISHLAITDSNYDVAITLLRNEFLDEEFIIDEIFKQIITTTPKHDYDFVAIRQYLTETRAVLYELKTSYGIDLLQENTAGNKLVGHIIFSKLPNILRRDLVHKVETNYPSVNQLFDNYNDLIKTLNRTSLRKSFDKGNSKTNSTSGNWKPRNEKASSDLSGPATLENFATNASPRSNSLVHCKFCNTNGHSMFNCPKYANFKSRQDRCKELKLCILCSSPKHISKDCHGKSDKLSFECKLCQSHSHISALCKQYNATKSNVIENHLCYTSDFQQQPFILPILNIAVYRGNQKHNVNCLVDTGSQRSYLSSSVFEKLGYVLNSYHTSKYTVKTFLGSQDRELKEVMTNLELTPGQYYNLPVLADNKFEINCQIDDLPQVVTNLRNLKYKLTSTFDDCNEGIKIHGLLGVDVLQFLTHMRLIRCMNGSAWEFSHGLVPFGNCLHFLYKSQIKPVESQCYSDTSCDKFESHSNSCPITHVNFVLEPKSYYQDPLDFVFNECSVERNLDQMFSIESIGIHESEDAIGDYDKMKIMDFKNSIEFKDNIYHVGLPWHDDKVKLVPSNYKVALAVLNSVLKKLYQQNLYEKYLEVFQQQEAEGIIERFEAPTCDYSKYIWIPHRPIIKKAEQVTTKIRPVFNCSLKTNGQFSLNEAAYPGINLMRNLFELLVHFRSNKYVLLGDIRKAFLRIKLNNMVDKNRFCFFMRENNQLICFRYTTIIFGYNASPFILNYIIKHHANKFDDDECTQMLNNNFYVDNLIKTSNSIESLSHLYSESVRRLALGNFQLRSCNSNSEELKLIMEDDQTIVDHGCNLENVLGYKYSTISDSIQLSLTIHDSSLNTKRGVLVSTAKVFDPLSLCLPVTVKGKILLRNLWMQKYGWDDIIADEFQKNWYNLSKDLSQLDTILFPRYVINEDEEAQLCIFCDASAEAYGFVVYVLQNNVSSMLFAKAKTAPLLRKSIPSLELLSVFLAVKSLETILNSYSNINISSVTLAVDSQIVLSWLLVNVVKCKNIFVKNRLRDITDMLNNLKLKFPDIIIKFKYVNTCENPADFVTRGLSFSKFQKQMQFWLHGPIWLSSNPLQWPVYDLNCLNSTMKEIVQTNMSPTCNVSLSPVFGAQSAQYGPIIQFDRFSNLKRLVNTVTNVFIFVNKIRKISYDIHECHDKAMNLLIKCMQQQCFQNEISFLLKPKGKEIPNLVRDLNLFIDNNGILRANGRIGKAELFSYDVINPIVLGKDHVFTNLMILSFHEKCLHLGISATLYRLRISGFWLPRGRQIIKNVISKCVLCQRFNNLAFRYPKLTNLPKHRVNFVKPYCYTGIDYTGHLWVQNKENKGSQKMYLLIFTCLNVRAIHLELLDSMGTHSLILAIIRFTNIHGIPTHIYSDNAKSFIAGCDLLSEVFASDEFKSKFQIYNIKHIRIPLFSAWVGSTWERLIRVVKSCLYKTIRSGRLEYFELLTVISDIQKVVNLRPLTYRCSSEDEFEIITPNCFIQPLSSERLIVNSDHKLETATKENLVKTLEIRNKLVNKFRDMWHNEYLLSLREQCKELHDTQYFDKIEIGDVVLIKSPAKTRPYWNLGRVIEIITGDDGKCRFVKVKRGDNTIGTHSIKLLYPIELTLTHCHQAKASEEYKSCETPNNGLENFNSDCNLVDEMQNQSNNISYIDQTKPKRPVRLATLGKKIYK